MRIMFPDGRVGECGIRDFQFQELLDLANSGNVVVKLNVKIKNAKGVSKEYDIDIQTIASFRQADDPQLKLFPEE